MLRQEMGKDEVKIDTLMLIELVHWYLTSLKGAVYSMDFYLELHVFGAVPVRKKMKFLTKRS